MSRKFTRSIGLFSLLAFPLAWVTLASSPDADLAIPPGGEAESGEASGEPSELGPINVALQDALYRSGLNPEALAAAGVTPGQVAAICDALRADLVEAQPILAAADAGVAEGRASVGRLSRLVRSGKATAAEVAELATCKTACDAALAQRQTCMGNFHAAACAVLPEAQRTALMNIQSNSQWKVPVPYQVVNRTPEQWMQLEEFLDIERIETRWGHEVPSEVTTVLAAARADAAYAAANAAYDTNLAALKIAANSSIRD